MLNYFENGFVTKKELMAVFGTDTGPVEVREYNEWRYDVKMRLGNWLPLPKSRFILVDDNITIEDLL